MTIERPVPGLAPAPRCLSLGILMYPVGGL